MFFVLYFSLLYLFFLYLEVSIQCCIIYARYNIIMHDTTTYEDGFFMWIILYL